MTQVKSIPEGLLQEAVTILEDVVSWTQVDELYEQDCDFVLFYRDPATGKVLVVEATPDRERLQMDFYRELN